MLKRFNTLKLAPQVLVTTGLFAIIAALSIDWGLLLCLVVLPALTFFNYAKNNKQYYVVNIIMLTFCNIIVVI